jgi:hypothetical protein
VRAAWSSIAVVLILLVISPDAATTQDSSQSRTQEFILDSSPNSMAYAMALDTDDNALLVGERLSPSSNDPFALEGMLLKVTPLGEVSDVLVYDDYELNALTDLALDSSGNVVLAGKYGERGGTQYGFVQKVSEGGMPIWKQEFENISFYDSVCIETDPTTDDVYFMGSSQDESGGIFLARISSTGSVQWEQTCLWEISGWLDMNLTAHSLLWSTQGLLVTGDMWDSSWRSISPPASTGIFASNGTEIKRFSADPWLLLELDTGEFLGRFSGGAVLCNSDLSQIWSTEIELHCDYDALIWGYCQNRSGNYIAYGSVLGVGKSPVKSKFSTAYEPAIIPQTLIVNLNETGGLEWYDFYILGDSSMPCGALFDSQGRLVIAGYSDRGIWILWDFHPTPFPSLIICDMSPIYFGLALVPVAVVLSWGLNRARTRRSNEDNILRGAISLFRKGGVISGAIAILTIGSNPFPPSFPVILFAGLLSVLLVATSYIMEKLARQNQAVSVSQPRREME